MTTWGSPVGESGAGWAVVDVETSGFSPGQARIISVAALAVDAQGQVERAVVSLLNPGVDPGPTQIHGLTAAMLEGQPQFADIVGDLADLLTGRTLVAHNVAFDYGFLVAEAEKVDYALPVDTVMCTVELARRLELGLDNLRLQTLAAHWGVSQTRPHDAFDDALVLTGVLTQALRRARDRDVWLPIRPVTRRTWPNGRVTHDELRPLKKLAPRMQCPYPNPGRYARGGPLIRGMRVALTTEVTRTHDELIERILHAGLAYTETVDPETSLVVCNVPRPGKGSGRLAREIGVPMVSDVQFLDFVDTVVAGTGAGRFNETAAAEQQFALF